MTTTTRRTRTPKEVTRGLRFAERRKRLLAQLREASGNDRRVLLDALNALAFLEREKVSERATKAFAEAGVALAKALRQQETAENALVHGTGSVARVRAAEQAVEQARRAFDEARMSALIARSNARRT